MLFNIDCGVVINWYSHPNFQIMRVVSTVRFLTVLRNYLNEPTLLDKIANKKKQINFLFSKHFSLNMQILCNLWQSFNYIWAKF